MRWPQRFWWFMPKVFRLIYIFLMVDGPELDQGSGWGVVSQGWCSGGACYSGVMQSSLLSWLLAFTAVSVCSELIFSPLHPGCSAASQCLHCNAVVLCLSQNRCKGLSRARSKALHSLWLEIMKIL